MSRTHRDSQRRLDHQAQRAWHRGSNHDPAEFPWRWIPRRGVDRKVARRWAWKWHKALRYKDPSQAIRGRLRII